MIAINEKYISPSKTMLFSLASHQKESLVVYLLYSSISKEKLEDFHSFLREKCNSELVAIEVDKELFANAPIHERFSEETYYRLLCFILLPESVKRILWLDGDIIVKGDIGELYNCDFEGNYAVACSENAPKHTARLGLSNKHQYFNAGVILYNLPAIRDRFVARDIFDCIECHKDHLTLFDQDVLNVLFENHVKYVDADIYNFGAFGFNVLPKSQMKKIEECAKIIHYKGSIKPWNYKGANWAGKYWWKYELERGDRMGAFIKYHLLHAPVVFFHRIRELYFIFLAQINKIGKKAK